MLGELPLKALFQREVRTRSHIVEAHLLPGSVHHMLRGFREQRT
jgi:hypothetical protein